MSFQRRPVSGAGAAPSGDRVVLGEGGEAPKEALTNSRALLVQYTKTVLSLSAFMFVSSVLIIVNKQVLVDDGFHFPLALTCIGQYFSALAALPLVAAGVVTVRPPPSVADVRDKILPTALCSAVTMFTGNFAYIYLSVAFIQILKAFTPAITLAMLVLLGMEPLAPVVVAAVLMIAVGTGGSVLVESATPAFHLLGFVSFTISSLSEAGRVVLFQVSMGKLRYNVFETLVYLSPVTGTILLVLSLAAEWEGLVAPGGGFSKIAASPGLYATATVMSFLVNMFTYLAIMHSSSLTFKVVGCVKNAAVVMFGVMLMGEHVSAGQGVGYAVSIAGFMMYTVVKMNRSRENEPATSRGGGPSDTGTPSSDLTVKRID